MNDRDVAGLIPVEVHPATASPDWWRKFHTYRRIRHHEVSPEDPLLPDDAVEAQMKRPHRYLNRRLYSIDEGERLVSTFSATTQKPAAPAYESNKHLLDGSGDVLNECRRRGLGRGWLPVIINLMAEYDCTVLTIGTEEDDGHAFFKWLGAEPNLRSRESRLDLTSVDWPTVRGWVEEGERRNPDTKLLLYENRVPPEALTDYCRSLTKMLNTIPFEDLDHGVEAVTPEQAEEHYARMALMKAVIHTYLAVERDGISGITFVDYAPHAADRVHQGFTGVDTASRGRGLGKWIKAAMLECVRDRYPEARWVVTGNANSNDPMLAINARLGFLPHRTTVYYQISLQKLAEVAARP